MRIVSAALHGESLSGFYPYITRVNRRLARSEVLIRNPMHTLQTDDDGISVALSDADNQASFESLALYRPPLGTFTLAFNVAQDALLSAAVSVHLTIVAGRAHHVGIAAPCAEERHATKPLLFMMMPIILARVQCMLHQKSLPFHHCALMYWMEVKTDC